jgi:hypothetical protein
MEKQRKAERNERVRDIEDADFLDLDVELNLSNPRGNRDFTHNHVRITNGEIVESRPRSGRKRIYDISDDLSSIPSYAELNVNNLTKEERNIFDVEEDRAVRGEDESYFSSRVDHQDSQSLTSDMVAELQHAINQNKAPPNLKLNKLPERKQQFEQDSRSPGKVPILNFNNLPENETVDQSD